MNNTQFYNFGSFCVNAHINEDMNVYITRINLVDGTCIEIKDDTKINICSECIEINIQGKYIKVYPDEIEDIKFKFTKN